MENEQGRVHHSLGEAGLAKKGLAAARLDHQQLAINHAQLSTAHTRRCSWSIGVSIFCKLYTPGLQRMAKRAHVRSENSQVLFLQATCNHRNAQH